MPRSRGQVCVHAKSVDLPSIISSRRRPTRPRILFRNFPFDPDRSGCSKSSFRPERRVCPPLECPVTELLPGCNSPHRGYVPPEGAIGRGRIRAEPTAANRRGISRGCPRQSRSGPTPTCMANTPARGPECLAEPNHGGGREHRPTGIGSTVIIGLRVEDGPSPGSNRYL